MMQQNINITGSQGITIIQAGRDVYYGSDGSLEAKGLLPKEEEYRLNDGAIRQFCFLVIDVAGHSALSKRFSLTKIDPTLNALRKWIEFIILSNEGRELSYAGDGGIFYFLKEKVDDRAVDNAVKSCFKILDGLPNFNSSSNKLIFQGERTDIRLKFAIDFGVTLYHKDSGNWRSEDLNTAAKLEKSTPPNAILITHNAFKEIDDSLQNGFKKISTNDGVFYIYSKERIIDPFYIKYFLEIARLRQQEFEHLDYFIDLYAIETKLSKVEQEARQEPVKAIEMINSSIKQDKNAIIFGESGSGKTFTSLKLFEVFKNEFLTREGKIPLFIELSQIKDKEINEVVDTLKDRFEQDKGRYIIFLDGLNETGKPDEQKKILDRIRRFAVLNQDTRLFVTSQTLDEYYKRAGFELYEIQPFRKEDVIEYLSRFKDKFEDPEGFYNALSDIIKEFISIPIFLSIFATTYEKDKPFEIKNPSQLLEKYENFLCGIRESEFGHPEIDKDLRKRVIPFIAFSMCKENKKTISLKEFNGYIQDYKEETKSFSLDEREVRETITHRFKLMNEREDIGFEFIHQTLRDYFAALYINNNKLKPLEIIKLVYRDAQRNDDMVNAIRFLVGIGESQISKEIIKEFIEKDTYLSGELFTWSSIETFEEELIDSINRKIDIYSREYLLHLNEVVLFYLKVLDLLQMAKRIEEPISANICKD